MNEPSSWHEVWEKKAQGSFEDLDLQQLISIDGFDTGAGQVSTDHWLSFVGRTRERLQVRAGDKVLEIGCGSGAFMLPMYQDGVEVFGIDYSHNHIRLCEHVMRRGVFKVSEANTIPFDSGMFDAVVSHSVFHYFGDLTYAESVVTEVARVLKPGGNAALLDINDEDQRETFESTRRANLGNEKYDKLYGCLKQLYFSRKWFADMAAKCRLQVDIEDQSMEGYANARFRYNVFLNQPPC